MFECVANVSCVPNIGCNVRLYSKHYMLQTLCAMFGRALDVMFGSALNIRCIVEGSDGCGGSVQTSLLPSLLSRPLKPQLFRTIARFVHFAHFAHFMYFYKLGNASPLAASSPVLLGPTVLQNAELPFKCALFS